MPATPDILCIGSVLWDAIGRSEIAMPPGSDVAGRITRLPGGVAFNIAATLSRLGLAPALLSAIGDDAAGAELVAECRRRGIEAAHVHRAVGFPTDRYLAIEDNRGLVAAVADAHSLERAGAAILTPLLDGCLASAHEPWRGLVVLDGNLTEALLAEIAGSPLFAAADLRLVPASPGKAMRLRPLLAHPRATLYVNRDEASRLCACDYVDALAAAEGLIAGGARRALVTDGARACADAWRNHPTLAATPPAVRSQRITGAGDTFVGAHIVAERNGLSRGDALEAALAAASRYVAGEIGS